MDLLASKRVMQRIKIFKKSVKPAKKPNTRIFLSVFIWYFTLTAFSLIDSPTSYSNDEHCQQTFSAQIDQLLSDVKSNPGIVSENELLNRKALEALIAVKTLAKISKTGDITVIDYQSLHEFFEFGLNDILNYPPELSARLLSNLYRPLPWLFILHNTRRNIQAKNILIEHFGKEHADVLKKLWEDENLSAEQMIVQFFKLEKILGSTKMDDYVFYLSEYDGVNRGNTSSGSKKIDSQVSKDLAKVFVKSIQSGASPNADLGKALNQLLDHKDQTSAAFAQLALVEAKQNEKLRNDPVVKIHEELLLRKRKRAKLGEEEKSFLKLLDEIMSDPKWNPKLKAGFLLTQVGRKADKNKHSPFNRYLNLVPENQRELLLGGIERHTILGVFRDLAKKQDRLLKQGNKFEKMLLTEGVLKSFQFQPIISQDQAKSGGVTFTMGEEGGKGNDAHLVTLTKEYALQVTTMTQLQISLLTGNNPSNFIDGEIIIQIGKKKIRLDPNRPVERISWEDIQKQVVKKLNKLAEETGSPYEYDLPTEAQWEYAARGGTETSFGDSEADLPRHGWTKENSGGQTHEVAGLRPNPFGLYDMHGNVWERVKDWYGDYSQGSVTDPSGPSSGSYRVVRGGGWLDSAQTVRSTYRGSTTDELEGYLPNDISLRLLRRLR